MNTSELTGEPFQLLNTLDRDVFVKAGGKRRKLHKAPPPVLLHAPGGELPAPLKVAVGRKAAAAEIDYYTSEQPLGVLSLPDRIPGVLYLVEDYMLAEFPFRDDFVAPAIWSVSFTKKKNIKKKGKGGKGSQYRRRHRTILVAVTRAPFAQATPDMQVLKW